MRSPCNATLTDLVSKGRNELLAGDEKSHDPNMASLSTLIDKFVNENKFHPEYCEGLEADMVLWVVKCSDIKVCPPVDNGGSELTVTSAGTASGCDGRVLHVQWVLGTK